MGNETKKPIGKPLIDGPFASPFAEGAARLAAIVRPGEPMPPLQVSKPCDRMSAISPDEAWGRRFMSMSIGPDLSRPIAPPPPVIEPVEQAVLAPRNEIAPERNVASAFAKPGKVQPIGAAIGKPVRRSLLSRMFSRS
ncbi:MAG TPA: hypothetical protein VGF56_13355 [Rhizomicrobium sp.]|jgi:hypothetical protein